MVLLFEDLFDVWILVSVAHVWWILNYWIVMLDQPCCPSCWLFQYWPVVKLNFCSWFVVWLSDFRNRFQNDFTCVCLCHHVLVFAFGIVGLWCWNSLAGQLVGYFNIDRLWNATSVPDSWYGWGIEEQIPEWLHLCFSLSLCSSVCKVVVCL